MEELYKLVANFKEAIKKGRDHLPEWFQSFPAGCCSDVTAMLGTYLKDKGCGDFMFVSGKLWIKDNYKTHAWLQKDNLIIDITANQFNGIEEDIIIADKSEWHDKWDAEPKRIANLISCSNINESAYHEIMNIAEDLERERTRGQGST